MQVGSTLVQEVEGASEQMYLYVVLNYILPLYKKGWQSNFLCEETNNLQSWKYWVLLLIRKHWNSGMHLQLSWLMLLYVWRCNSCDGHPQILHFVACNFLLYKYTLYTTVSYWCELAVCITRRRFLSMAWPCVAGPRT
jgi:hypothetical protein